MRSFCSNSQNIFQVRTPVSTRSPYGCLETYVSAWGDTFRTYQRQPKQLDPEHGDPRNPRLGF